MNLAFEPENDPKEKGVKDRVVGFMQKYILAKSSKSGDKDVSSAQRDIERKDSCASQQGESDKKIEKKKKKGTFIDRVIDNRCPENSGSCLKTFKVLHNLLIFEKDYCYFQLFLNCLTMTFIAEWGDRSQLATIVLAGINNVYGVIVGEGRSQIMILHSDSVFVQVDGWMRRCEIIDNRA